MTTARAERRLAAILAADVAGYSRLMERDEAGTLERLKAHHRELVEPLLAEHRGRVVKLMGDGALCEFTSAVEAVECAVRIQRGMVEREREVPDAERLRFRIGINLGDVIHEADGDLYGDGVNIAARLEGLAEPGGVVVSGTAYDHLQGKLDCGLVPMGEQRLKNIERPVRAYRVDLGTAVATSVTAPPPLPDKPAIAVLPFDNLSGDPEQAYFSDGITEDVITELSRFRELLVIARNSSFAFRGKAMDVREIGRALGAGFVVEGSVRRAGARVRITAQLIDAATGAHLWAERYDRPLEDVFAIQDEVARGIVAIVAARSWRNARLPHGVGRPVTCAPTTCSSRVTACRTQTRPRRRHRPGSYSSAPVSSIRPSPAPTPGWPSTTSCARGMPVSGSRVARTPTGGRLCGWPSARWHSTPTTRAPTTRSARCV